MATAAITVFEIPTTNSPQTFTISLSGVVYTFTIKWSTASACWVIDIADSNNNAIVSGIAMTTGEDLLGQFAYLGIGGQLIAQTDNDAAAPPTYANLGTAGHLYFIPATGVA